MTIHKDFACPECQGTGECSCCGSEESCRECDGTGIDGSVVDVAAYQRACSELNEESRQAGHCGLSCAAPHPDSIWTHIGRKNAFRAVLLKDFVLEVAQ